MSEKRHKRKSGYTVMIVSDSTEKNQGGFHLDMRTMYLVAFVSALLLICYAEYTGILAHGATARSETYAGQIMELQKENEALKAENERLGKENANLNQNLSQKEAMVQRKEETLQAVEQEKNMPKGLPVSGVSQIKETGGENTAGMLPIGEQKEVIFVATPPTNANSAGAGTVLEVLRPDGEPTVIRIDHGNGYVSTYRNAGTPKVAAGDLVERGAALFEIGRDNTEVGYSVSKDGAYLDPMEIIEIKG